MRILSSHHPVRLGRALFVASLVVVATGCGGGGSSSGLPNGNGICDSNAGSISIARPSSGFGMNGNNVEIVDSTNADQLNQFPNQFDLILRDNFNNEIDTGLLSAVADTGGPHPYSTDFFYQGTLPVGLLGGRTYNVYLNSPNTNCTPGLIGQFST